MSDSSTGYGTDGGFPLQMRAISNLFARTSIVVPCSPDGNATGLSPITGNNLEIVPVSVPKGRGIRRKLGLGLWLFRNVSTLIRQIRKADAVHTPIPGDIGSFGLILALIFRKPLFVRHCGNWTLQRTAAERFWKWAMERYANGKYIMFATGGGITSPSEKNKNIKWIFSTSISENHVAGNYPKQLRANDVLRLVIACRQEDLKGTDLVIDCLPSLVNVFRDVSLDVIGGGSKLPEYLRRAESHGVANRITFHGRVEQSRVPELLRKADIFCYPTAASEGFPKVVLEALASGLPVITTKVSVLPVLLSSGCGLLLEQRSAEALAEAIIKVGKDERLYAAMSAKAIETASAYTLENWQAFIGEELRRAWGDCLDSKFCKTNLI